MQLLFKLRLIVVLLIFPANGATLSLVYGNTSDLLNNFPAPPAGEMATALTDCKKPDSTQVPLPASQGPYIFCVALRNPNPTGGTSFVDSEGAFLQIRVELLSSEMSQDVKQFGSPLACNDWSGRGDQRQFKVIYRIFWKKYGDPNGFFSTMGSQVLNRFELEPN